MIVCLSYFYWPVLQHYIIMIHGYYLWLLSMVISMVIIYVLIA